MLGASKTGWLGRGAWFLGCALAFAACGGGSGATNAPAQGAHDADSKEPESDDATDEDSAREEAAPKAAPCDDGTCSPCGSGICPSGWYCDESAAGGPACGWLPSCAQKSSCACLTAKLGSSCSCREQAGGLHVTCK